MTATLDSIISPSLIHSERPPSERELQMAMRMLPLKERSLLRLLYQRGASFSELAGVLGVSQTVLRRILRRAMARASDPEVLALLRCWRRLTDDERRLVHLNRVLGISIAEIARQNLIPIRVAGGEASVSTRIAKLRLMVRCLHRKIRRRRRSEAAEAESETGE
jgi:DNA-directed RNA polymerase specialized sigma24 family protein